MDRTPLSEFTLAPNGTDRRTVLAAAVAMIGAPVVGMQDAFARPAGPSTAYLPNTSEPATAADYMSTMRLGAQASDFLEMPNQAAGLAHAVGAADYDRMRIEGRFDHVRIPANCAARADVNGKISESFLLVLDAQIALALARFERVILDPLHHYLQWKGDYSYLNFFDDYARVGLLTAAEHAVRATAMWTQLATRYREVSTRLSFDLFNEPSWSAPVEGRPMGLVNAQLLAWHNVVIPAIRNTGGRNANRMIWLEPWLARLSNLVVPSGMGVIGVSQHIYNLFQYTHGASELTAGAMSTFAAEMRYTQQWGVDNGVPVWIGEAGVSINVSALTVPRPPEQRAEFVAFIRETALRYGMPVCYWGYNSNFALYDEKAGAWMPLMLRAVTALPAPLPMRPAPPFMPLSGGRIAKLWSPGGVWSGFAYDPVTGILTAPANTTGVDQTVQLVFPAIPVSAGQCWLTGTTRFRGNWRFSAAPFYYDAVAKNRDGVPGLDLRSVDAKGQAIYPAYRQRAPGGVSQSFAGITSPGSYIAVDVSLEADSAGGYISFTYLQDI